jgi:hypothetical protein
MNYYILYLKITNLKYLLNIQLIASITVLINFTSQHQSILIQYFIFHISFFILFSGISSFFVVSYQFIRLKTDKTQFPISITITASLVGCCRR